MLRAGDKRLSRGTAQMLPGDSRPLSSDQDFPGTEKAGGKILLPVIIT